MNNQEGYNYPDNDKDCAELVTSGKKIDKLSAISYLVSQLYGEDCKKMEKLKNKATKKPLKPSEVELLHAIAYEGELFSRFRTRIDGKIFEILMDLPKKIDKLAKAKKVQKKKAAT